MALTLVVLAAAACKGKKQSGKSPEEVAITFAKAMSRGDYETAKSVSTEETKKAIDQVKQMAMTNQNAKKEGDFEVKSKNVEGDNATVKLFNKLDNKESDVYLKKVNGKWLVSMDKQQITNKGGDVKKDENIEDLGSKDDSKAKYKIGTKVAAIWISGSDRYYPGTIHSIAGDKEYYVKWRDGSKPSKVPEDRIVPMTKDLKLKPGDKVQAVWGSSFWDAEVKKVIPAEKKAVIIWTSDKKEATVDIDEIFKKP
ncbi:MAG: DUF4878 domain-containing protein [Bacteroidia bacterium]|nr:DUF4878 domain-containing protein [Bacteroidia bacterium]